MADETHTNFTGSVPENYDRHLGPNIFADYAADIAARAAAGSPRAVLELAAGTGIVSRKLRDALPADTDLVVSDLNAPMLEVAQAKFAEGERVHFQPADAQALDHGDDSFDVLVCQFGVMFFPDKGTAFREALRVLAPGGRYIFNTWDTLERNTFSRVAGAVAEAFFPDDPPSFYKVPFSYGDTGAVMSDVRSAGFADVTAETIEIRKTIADPAGFAYGLVFGNPLIEEIRNRGGVEPEEVVDALLAALLSSLGENPTEMTLSAHVFTCTAPTR